MSSPSDSPRPNHRAARRAARGEPRNPNDHVWVYSYDQMFGLRNHAHQPADYHHYHHARRFDHAHAHHHHHHPAIPGNHVHAHPGPDRDFDLDRIVGYTQAAGSSGWHAAEDRKRLRDTSPPCPICLDEIPRAEEFVVESCQHKFCVKCISKHITLLAEENSKYPIPCPMCDDPLDDSVCLSLVEDRDETYRKLNRLIIERGFCSQLRYCANEECGEPFDWEPNPDVAGNPYEFRVECPICEQATCVNCLQRWHEGKTCKENQKDGGDDNVEALGRRMGWTRCPQCRTLVDRRKDDCYFVRCRCGCGFCHKCGAEYQSSTPTRDNEHGKPSCNCGLFGDNDEHDDNLGRNRIFEGLRELQHGLDRLMVQEFDREDPAPGHEGRNGFVSLGKWVDDARMRRKLSPNMVSDLISFRCPYTVCGKQFGSLRALEQHLASVQRHDVWLCCGRPFYSERSREQHRLAVHGEEMYLF
eukprot:GFKZ01000126.1.p1 GENE.GFKZ01000126.1~~GFKZ01000126.1.p1  ORF type:complete len:471 (-),score=30.36 GFKZ01000126.1:438-1850(-)